MLNWLIDWWTDLIRITEPDRCHSLPCQNGGTCIQEITGTYKCQCQEGFRGFNCEGQQLKANMLVWSWLTLDSLQISAEWLFLFVFFFLVVEIWRRIRFFVFCVWTQFYNNSWSIYFKTQDKFYRNKSYGKLSIILTYDDGKSRRVDCMFANWYYV